MTFISKGIFRNLEVSKIFAKETHPYVKFDRKHNGDVSEDVESIDHELCRNFLQKWDQEPLKIEPPKF